MVSSQDPLLTSTKEGRKVTSRAWGAFWGHAAACGKIP